MQHHTHTPPKRMKICQPASWGLAGNVQREMKYMLAGSEKIKLCWMGREILRRKLSQFRKLLIMCLKIKHMLQYFLTNSLCASSQAHIWASCWAGALQWSSISCLKWRVSLRDVNLPFLMSLALFHHLSSPGTSTCGSCPVSSISNALAMGAGGQEPVGRGQDWLFQHMQVSWTQTEDTCQTALCVSSATQILF